MICRRDKRDVKAFSVFIVAPYLSRRRRAVEIIHIK